MQKILVAGGAGFIGSHLCHSLLEKQYIVFCVDNLLTGNKQNIVDCISNPNFTFLEEDIIQQNFKSQISSVRQALDKNFKFDYIFHLASPASPNKNSPRSYINYPIETLLVNSIGTYNLLELAKEDGAKFLYASSSEIYGDPTISPQPETYLGNVNPNGIRSVYDEGKRFGESMTFGFVRKHGVDCRVIRIFNTYGPWMQKDDGRVVSNFINQALTDNPMTIYGDGNQTRSFCFVDDMVAGIEKAMFIDTGKAEVFNLGNPDERKISEIATIIKWLVESSSAIVFESLPEDDPKNRCPDITKAKDLLNWEPKVALEDGLKKTIEYFRNL